MHKDTVDVGENERGLEAQGRFTALYEVFSVVTNVWFYMLHGNRCLFERICKRSFSSSEQFVINLYTDLHI